MRVMRVGVGVWRLGRAFGCLLAVMLLVAHAEDAETQVPAVPRFAEVLRDGDGDRDVILMPCLGCDGTSCPIGAN